MVDKTLGEFVNVAVTAKVDNNGAVSVLKESSLLDPAVEWVVIDDTNHRVAGEGNPPIYIDRSYIADYPTNKFLTVTDTKTRHKYHLFAKRVVSGGYPVALVITAKEANSVVVSSLLPYFIAASLLVVIIALYQRKHSQVTSIPIIFNKTENRLERGELNCPLPYGSLQTALVAVLFKKPQKRFEYDELCEAIALSSENISDRKSVYDAARAINLKCQKKFGLPLISIETKSLRVNPLIHSQSS